MLYASSRMNALSIAESQGLKISKKVCVVSCRSSRVLPSNAWQIEASAPDEISGDRLHEEVYPPQDQGPKRGFAKPRRPGR